MPTNAATTRKAFTEWYETYIEGRTHSETLEELKLIFDNNDYGYYRNFITSRKVKAHSAAFYSVILAIFPFMPAGYYASNAQIKANILHFFRMDFKDFLAPLVAELEKERNNYLAK